jgi:hypothetical protein
VILSETWLWIQKQLIETLLWPKGGIGVTVDLGSGYKMRTAVLTHRVEGLEVTKDKILGAGKLLAVIGSSGGVVGGIVAVIKMLKHGGKIP